MDCLVDGSRVPGSVRLRPLEQSRDAESLTPARGGLRSSPGRVVLRQCRVKPRLGPAAERPASLLESDPRPSGLSCRSSAEPRPGPSPAAPDPPPRAPQSLQKCVFTHLWGNDLRHHGFVLSRHPRRPGFRPPEARPELARAPVWSPSLEAFKPCPLLPSAIH
jgi:hypothetical protein